MRQGFLRALAASALCVVTCAPAATGAGASPSGSGSAPGVAERPTRALTWGDVAGRLRQAGRLTRGPAGRAEGARSAAAVTADAAVPSMTVTPSTGLLAGQQVTVAGTGFAAGRYVLVQCAGGSSSPTDCDIDGVSLVQPDTAGAFSADIVLRRTLHLTGRRLDCATAAGACDLLAINIDSVVVLATTRVPLAFDPNAPTPHPSIVLTPASGLLDKQTVSVAGTGFAPGSSVALSQCTVGGITCTFGASGQTLVGADGKFTASFSVSLRANTDFGGLTTCIATPCEVQAQSFDAPDYFATAALRFDPSQPVPPPPAITVTPATGLRHDQVVAVHGTHFDPNTYVEISECPPNTTGSCGDFLGDVQSDASGAFDVSIAVTRLVTSFDAYPQVHIIDCGTGGCSLSASSFDSQLALVAAKPIAFDPSVAPPALPTVTVTPDSDLPYRADVHVHGTGFTPDGQVNAIFCMSGPQDRTCGFEAAYGVADGGGVIDLTLTVQRRFTSSPGAPTLDCVDASTTCSVLVTGSRSYQQALVPVTFDPNAVVPPPPTMTVTPDHDLGYRQSVTVTGDGFAPGSAFVSECGPLDPEGRPIPSCLGVDVQLTVDGAGHFQTTVGVERVLDFGPGLSIDCAVQSAPCVLQVSTGGFGDSVSAPLHFDPNSQPPPPAALTVTPSTSLFDGQHVTAAGRNFTPGSRVGITECRAGATVIADTCDISRVRAVTVGTDGTFSIRFVTASVIGTADGPFDCTTAPSACVLAAANAPSRPEFARAPLGFAPPELAVTGIGVREGTGGMTMAPVRVALSKPDRNPITVRWVAEATTASPGTDYTSMRGTVTIPAGATEAMIDTSVVADALDEPTETFQVRVVDALGTRIVDRIGTVTIHDDDAAPTVTIRDTSRREDHGEAHPEVVLSAPSGRTVIVHYVTHHGTARSGSDYVRKDGRLVFAPGETRHVVRAVLVNDRVHEPTETFVVEIDEVEQASVARAVGTVTITDDD